ncbi:Alpha/Beta hydrolase protein [Lophiotrema nucula]|uniref:Alpha/Beta hydrolase protein n=1 Tax=Lophiotrema nucula TaxID=690887 RepID=A0A6A5YJW9_9PLEO|nr:Alpha/Beta hydrolase protein [Lophiotrema nucula]
MPSKPAFVLLPGAWCPSTFYEKLVPRLQDFGYDAYSLDLPSTLENEDTSPPSFYDDAKFVRLKIIELSDHGKTVVVVGNSYGGFLANEAIKGVLQSDRASVGKKGGVLHFVVLASLLPIVGKTVSEHLTGLIPIDLDAPVDWFPSGPAEMSAQAFLNHLPEEEGLKYGGLTRSHSSKSFKDPITYAAYDHIPTTVVIGMDDVALKPEVQEARVDEVIAAGNKHVKKTIIKADHIPQLSHPDEIAQICVNAAQFSKPTQSYSCEDLGEPQH